MRLGITAAVGTEVLYGCGYVVTKHATGLTDPMTVLAWRFSVALIALGALSATGMVRVRITRATLPGLALLAVLQPLTYYLGETYGVAHTTASESGLILAAIPVASLLAAIVVVGSRPSTRQVVGIGVTLVGVIVTVVADGFVFGGTTVGYAGLLIAVLAFALYSVCAQRFSGIGDIEKTTAMVVAGALLFTPMALTGHAATDTLGEAVALPLRHPAFAAAVAFLALGCTVAAFFLQNTAIAVLGATRYSSFIGVSTLTALICGSLFLHERLSPLRWAAGATILIGVYLANRGDSGRDQASGVHRPAGEGG